MYHPASKNKAFHSGRVKMTESNRSLWGRILRRPALIEDIVNEGKRAFADGNPGDNPYPKGTMENRSWQKGYDSADDWMYVW
jgi:hypothetical protein